MLQAILAEFRTQGVLSLESLSQRFEVEPSALEGMLLTLVRRGRLLEIDGAELACEQCPAHQLCHTPCPTSSKVYLFPNGS